MASFSIPDVPPKAEITPGTVDAKSGKQLSPHTGAVVFTVNNTTGEIKSGNLSVIEVADDQKAWFAIDGEVSQEFGTSGGETIKVNISVPTDAKPGDYSFRLLVAEVNDTDNDYEKSQSTAFTVPPAKKIEAVVGKKSKWWLWVLLGIVLLAIVGGVVWFLTRDKGDDGDKGTASPPTETATVSPPTNDPSPRVVLRKIPDLKGTNLSSARRAALGFELVSVAAAPGGAEPGTIVSQKPEFGLPDQPVGTLLRVTYDPGVKVPVLEGQTVVVADRLIASSGLRHGRVSIVCVAGGMNFGVVTQSLPKNSMAKSGSNVDVVIGQRTMPSFPVTTLPKCVQQTTTFANARQLAARFGIR